MLYIGDKNFCCIINHDYLRSIASGLAVCMGVIMLRKLKIAIHKFLLEMAKDNQELYGKDRMDCCKLNSDRSKKR